MSDILNEVLCGSEIYNDIVQKHFDDRRIIINSEISDNLLEEVCLAILMWNQEDKDLPVDKRQKIYIYINSDGGGRVIGNQIISTIISSKTPVVTVGFSKCASMACLILAAGHERYCFPHTMILYHDGQSGYISSGNKGKDIQKFFNDLDDIENNFMIKYTKMSEEFLENIKDREYYMFGAEGKELGIVDKIIGIDCEMDEIL